MESQLSWQTSGYTKDLLTSYAKHYYKQSQESEPAAL